MPENPTVTGYVGTALIQPTAAEATGQAGIDMRANLTEIASKLRFPNDDGTMSEEAWSAPTLVNSWVDFGGVLQASTYRKTRNKVVEMRGVIKSGTASTGTLLFTLPAGYRPLFNEYFPVVSAGSVSGVSAWLQIGTTGAVTIIGGVNNVDLSITFRFSTV